MFSAVSVALILIAPCSKVAQAIQAVKNGEVDFAVVTTPTGAEGELKKVDLMSFNEILVGGKTFTALASRTLSLQELDAYPLIMLGNESMSRRPGFR